LQGLGNAVPKGLFTSDVKGRVTPVGSFSGLNDSAEYFFVLGIPTPPAYIGFSKATIAEFTSGCPEVAASTVYLETSLFNPQNQQIGISVLKEVSIFLKILH
jgi:hypothetical protein